MIKLKTFDKKTKGEYTDSKMAKIFSQDELVNGLCLLQCLKTEEVTLNDDELLGSARAVLKAASLVKKFQSENQMDNNEVDIDELLRKKDGNSELV